MSFIDFVRENAFAKKIPNHLCSVMSHNVPSFLKKDTIQTIWTKCFGCSKGENSFLDFIFMNILQKVGVVLSRDKGENVL